MTPLQRRLLAGTQQLPGSEPVVMTSHAMETESETAIAPQAAGHATLGMLDGTVLARLECHEEMGTAIIGRGSMASVRVQDPYVHRIHCEIHWDPVVRAHIITHGDGSNGTFVNLQRITGPTRLLDGARIRIGKTELIYRRAFYPGM